MDKNQEAQIVNQLSSNINPVVSDVQKLITDVVVLVEQYETQVAPLSNDDKEQVAVDLANGVVKLPFPLSLFQKFALKMLVKYAVSKLNETHGHNWPQAQPAIASIPMPKPMSTAGTSTSQYLPQMALPPKTVEPEHMTDNPDESEGDNLNG
jgi:hypothetical protein